MKTGRLRLLWYDMKAVVYFHATHALSQVAILVIFGVWAGAAFMNVEIPRMVERATLAFIELTARETARQVKDIRQSMERRLPTDNWDKREDRSSGR